jgi:hypothetical protein
MAEIGMLVTERVVQEEMGGTVDRENNAWIIPLNQKKLNE